MVALVEQVGIDLADALDGTGDVDAHRVVVEHGTEHIEEHTPAGFIIIHADLLGDDALFFFHVLLGEIRLLHEGEQDLQGLRKILRAGEQVGRPVEGGVGIGIGAGAGIFLEGVAVLVLKELVLQIVCNALRHFGILFLALDTEPGIDGTVFCSKEGKGRMIALHFHDIDIQTVLVLDVQAFCITLFAADDLTVAFHYFPPPCCMRYTVSRLRAFATAMMSSRVRAR